MNDHPGLVPLPILWGDPDNAEHGRLEREMTEDAAWQFRIFTFALTAAGVLLSVLGPILGGSIDHIPTLSPAAKGGLPQYLLPFFFLSPLVSLIPSSYIVLNRARARNRKAAYMICFLDYKRLRLGGATDKDSWEDIKRHADLPWEAALHLLHKDRERPHVAPALRYMAVTYLLTEWVCFLLAGSMLTFSALWSWPAVTVFAIVVVFEIVFVIHRWALLLKLRRDRSIQGYAKSWLEARFADRSSWPRFFREWIEECEKVWAESWPRLRGG